MQTPPASKELMDAVVYIARGAGKLTLQWFGKSKDDLQLETKSDGSPVTAADKAAERYIRERIEELAPGSSIIGEEEAAASGEGSLTWYIDPIDGTKSFARGVPLYATLFAVDDEYGAAAGVIYIPPTDEIVYAGRGLGAWTDSGPAVVSTTSDLTTAYVTTSSVRRWGTDVFDRVVATGAEVRGWGDGYGFLMAATGRVDVMIDLHGGNVWDFAPMPVIFSEAGGKATAPDGVCTTGTPSLIASNGVLHDQVLALIKG